MNLSFAGCGFLGIYHVGVAACLKKYAPHLLVNKISGASAGAIAGCCLLCDVPLGEPLFRFVYIPLVRVIRQVCQVEGEIPATHHVVLKNFLKVFFLAV